MGSMRGRTRSTMPADFLPDEAALRGSVEPVVDELRNWSVNREYHAVTEPEMDQLCIAYITEAFHELGLNLSEGRRFTLDEAAREMGVHEKHRPYLGRLLELLSLHGIIKNDAGVWRCRSSLPVSIPDRVLLGCARNILNGSARTR